MRTGPIGEDRERRVRHLITTPRLYRSVGLTKSGPVAFCIGLSGFLSMDATEVTINVLCRRANGSGITA